jgi:ABC-type branched-subunit amino acid transport system ATPase component
LGEPAGGVNPPAKILLTVLAAEPEGITFLIVEHNMDLVMKISNGGGDGYGAVLAHGRLRNPGRPARLEAYLEVMMGTLVVVTWWPDMAAAPTS